MHDQMSSHRPVLFLIGLATLLAGCGSEEIVGTDGIDAAVAPPGVHLAFTVQPSTTSANATMSPALKVTVLDGQGNVYTGFSGKINVALENNPTAATLMGTKSQTVLSGVATFSNLSIKKSGSGYTLSAKATISGTPLTVTSDPFDVTPGSLWIIKFDTVPVPTVAGQTISPVRVVAIDSFFNRVTSFNETVGIGINTANPPGGALLGTTSATAVSGVATFSDLSIQKVATYSLRATWGTLITNSNNFKITPAAATHLLFTVPPKTTAAGAKFNPALKVTAYDQFENKATQFTGNVTMSIGNNPSGGTLSGTLTWAAVAGVATFSGTLGLSIDKAGVGYTLVASSDGLTSVTSNPFDIGAGTAAVLVFTVQPSNTAPGAVITPPVQVTMKDAQGNTVSTFGGNITLTIGANPGGGTLSGTRVRQATNGTATFAGLSINNAGTGYTLQASGGNKSGTSAPFDIGAGAGATQLAFTVQPSTARSGTVIAPPVKVAAQDAQGATITGFTGNVTISIAGNPTDGVLSGTTTVAAVAGVATFSNLSIDRSGVGYSLQAQSGSLQPAFSDAFTITGTPFVMVSGGNGSSCGLTAAGKAYCWGDNTYGQVGDGTNIDRRVPTAVSGNLTFASISAGDLKACGVTTSGQAYCWGRGESGALGNGSTSNSTLPVPVSGGQTFSSVSATGQGFACGVTTSGAGYCWGYGAFYTLGTGNNSSTTTPVAVAGGHTFSAISAGRQHSCGVSTSGDGYCWGQNDLGQIGNGSTSTAQLPSLVTGGLSFNVLSASDAFTCGVATDGAAYCWGNDNQGELGNGVTTESGVATPTPAAVSGGLTFSSVTAGSIHACGTVTSGAAYCWGAGDNGQLGNGTFTSLQNTPVLVSGGISFLSPRAGSSHTCGVTTGEETYCWGSNRSGQLGTGSNGSVSNVPMAVMLP